MRLTRRNAIIFSALFISLMTGSRYANVLARGGGGGFRSGGFNRGDFDRGDFNRGDFNRSDLNDIHGYYGEGIAHRPEAAGDRDYVWNRAQQHLATDGGLGGTSSLAPGTTRRMTPAQLASRATDVRNNYGYTGAFNGDWWGAHPGAWGDAGWGNSWAWGGTSWPVMAGFWGMPVETVPTPYDYGNNITYQNDTVYYGSQPTESSLAYYGQAQALALTAPVTMAPISKASEKDWKPLGVYSLIQGDQTNTNMMFQLAVNKEGVIKGNYYNTLTEETKPVSGAIDKKNMRAAWTIAGNKNVVYDTGLANLLSEQSSVLIHMGKEKTQQWTLVKLKQQKKDA